MITLHNLNKYFNKNKNNEIHVINDISLTLPSKGLVVLLGPSGSGKTTLLNVLGGLDKTQSGIIDFDGQEIKGYKSKTWDHIRNEHIGYVFQNYNLLYDQTVYDNIALSLKMVGITEKEEIDTRVDYLLDNMGMINYRRRKAAALSGGQQQRVAIARALAKNPKVIIADEPTGNLDSKNTFDIMNILRAISQTKLVVLVTHEQNVAELYADRIIRLKDGVIVEDIENKSIGGVDVQLETDIYLKDLDQITNFEDKNVSYNVYSDEETDTNFNVNLIVRNKTLYVEVKSDQFTRINLLEKDSEVKVFNEHFKGQEIEEFSQTEFDLTKVIDESKRTEGGSVIPFKEAFRLGISEMTNMTKMKMFRNILFVLNSVVVGIALALLFNVYQTDNVDFIEEPINQISVRRGTQTFDEMSLFESESSIDYLSLIDNANITITLPKVYQSSQRDITYSSFPMPSIYMDSKTLILGRGVQNQNEIVLNEFYVEQVMKDSTFESLGIQTMEDFMKLKFTYQLKTTTLETITVELQCVGITDVDDMAFYALEETLWQISTGIPVYEAYKDDVTIAKGSFTDDYRSLYVLDNAAHNADLSNVNTELINGLDFSAEASFTTTDTEMPDMLVKLESLKESVYASKYLNDGGSVYFITNDPEAAIKVFEAEDTTFAVPAVHPYASDKLVARAERLIQNIPYIMFAGVFLTAAFLGTYFIMRSSLLSKIYEVSVYRALGAPKSDLRRLFLIETIILTIFTSLLGYLAITYILVKLQVMTEGYFEVVRVSPLSFTVGLLVIILVNIVSGMLPISTLLRRTPAEIISKYDF